MLRPARSADIPAMAAFLAERAETSMFLMSNLAGHGLDERHHPHGTTYWLWEDGAGLQGVLGVTNGGYLMAQAPGADRQVWDGWVAALQGRLVRGITGEDRQVRQALGAMGLRADAFATNHAEPLYRLELARLDRLDDPGDPGGTLRTAGDADRPLLTEWYTAYLLDTGLTDDVTRAGEEAAARALAASRPGAAERLLVENGRPVAAASINAQVAEMVQVGGVFVPAAERNRGLGRRVTAARLALARDEGARTAILFANNTAAARAYEAIGFQRIGDYRVAVLKAPLFLGGGT